MRTVKRFLHTHRRVSGLLVFMCLLIGFPVLQDFGWIRGQLAARWDVARGHYKVLLFGLPMADRPEYVRLLRQRYEVEGRVVAGCLISHSLVAYAVGYNSFSMNAAKRKFGRDVFVETRRDAATIWKLRGAGNRGEKDSRQPL
jgi:hypothetical protein